MRFAFGWPWLTSPEQPRPTHREFEMAKAAVSRLTDQELHAIGIVARSSPWWPGLVAYRDMLECDERMQ